MDNNNLDKKIQNFDIPPADENARKAALNLAMAEFKLNNQKKSQGFSLLARLMGKSTSNTGRDPMEQRTKNRMIYGGMATAMAVVLIVGGSLTQMQSSDILKQEDGLGGVTNFSTNSGNVKNSTSSNTPAGPGQANRIIITDTFASGDGSSGGAASEKQEMAEADVSARAFAPQALMSLEAVSSSMIVADDYYMPPQQQNRDTFESVKVNPVKIVAEEPVSTFSSDVDTASYSFVRNALNNGQMPNPDAVRVEEMVNYFDYNYPAATSLDEPFKPTVTITESPWNTGKKLIHIGIKGYEVTREKPRSNLVFLLDVSGSMSDQNKLPLLKQSMKILLDTLDEDDTIAIAVYAGAAGTVLEPTKVSDKAKILAAIDNLQAGGSTAGEAGIKLAYSLAEQNFDKEAVNRIILATDGDFNVGTSDTDELKKLVEDKRKSGVFLSVFGFGMGNYQDDIMQTIAQNGNGVAAYIDNLNEARKVLVEEATSSLIPIAKDVKFQVEFNPERVAEYRLVGYETRHLNREDFNNDKVDAGDIGSGHTVTAIYEIAEFGSESISVDPLRYGEKKETAKKADPNAEYAFLKIRFKKPDEDTSKLITTPITNDMRGQSSDTQFSSAVAGFAQLLKKDEHITWTYDDVIETAQASKGDDPYGHRTEFIQLVRMAKTLDK